MFNNVYYHTYIFHIFDYYYICILHIVKIPFFIILSVTLLNAFSYDIMFV